MAQETLIAPILASMESQGAERQMIVRAFEVARDVVFWFVVLIILWRLEHAVRVPYHLQLANKRSRALPAARAILHSHALERVFYDEDDDDHGDD